MSAASATSARDLPRRSRTPSDPPALRALSFVCSIPLLTYLGWRIVDDWSATLRYLPEVGLWLLAAAAMDARPLPLWGSLQVALSFPVLLAAAFVFPSHVASLLGIVGTLDLREFRREVSLAREALNRSIIGTSVLGASSVFHALGGDVRDWPSVLLPALVALLVDMAINGTLVAAGTHILTGAPLSRVVWHMTGAEHRAVFLSSYVAFGLLAVSLGTMHASAGSWSPVAFGVPLFLARRMFDHWKDVADISAELVAKQRALHDAMERIAEERREERLTVAADIHDEVLQPLYQGHLLGQVIRQDLATGRLLELEEDVPHLLRAADAANTAIREILREVRSSPLGSRGLPRTLSLLAEELRGSTDARISLDLEDVGGSPLTQLLVYQVAREALLNAVRHSGAAHIRVSLKAGDGYIRLVVADDGTGLPPGHLKAGHFGLQLMRERAEIAGGSLVIHSTSEGVTIVAKFPLDAGV